PESCEDCGTDLAMGARFCHLCGQERAADMSHVKRSRRNFTRILSLDGISARMGLSLAAVIAFFIGLVCAVAAAAVGLVYSATTLLDWQAVQLWRMEWLLAALTAFVAGILLNKDR